MLGLKHTYTLNKPMSISQNFLPLIVSNCHNLSGHLLCFNISPPINMTPQAWCPISHTHTHTHPHTHTPPHAPHLSLVFARNIEPSSQKMVKVICWIKFLNVIDLFLVSFPSCPRALRTGRIAKFASYPGTKRSVRMVPPVEGSGAPRTKPGWAKLPNLFGHL